VVASAAQRAYVRWSRSRRSHFVGLSATSPRFSILRVSGRARQVHDGGLGGARVALVTAQRDRVVASYTLLSATGARSPQVLGLKIQVYDPIVHYQQVRDAWDGMRTLFHLVGQCCGCSSGM
jgi:hypothetical protein